MNGRTSFRDLSGRRFGRLMAVAPTSERKSFSVVWSCRCDCGQAALVSARHLNMGTTRSCGCMSTGGSSAGPNYGGLSQYEVARILNIPRQTVARIEVVALRKLRQRIEAHGWAVAP